MYFKKKISILLIVASVSCFSADLIVYWDDVRQTITGFGASGAYSAGNFQRLDSASKVSICDLLFDSTRGIGFNMIRNEIKTWSIEPSLGTWNWTTDANQIWLMNEAKKRGATYFWSAPWSPPAYMKSNNSTTYGGNLLPASYQDYADLLSRYVREYKSRFNLDIKAISIQNEPGANVSYESCLWNGTQFHDFVKNNLGPTFRRDNVTAKIILPESGRWDELLDDINPAMEDSICRSYIDIVAGHQYDQTTESPFFNFAYRTALEPTYGPCKRYGKELWQTETSYIGSASDTTMLFGLGTAMLMHNMLAGAEVNAWVWWVYLNSWGDNEGLCNLSGSTFRTTKRLYCMGNFSKFVRPGYQMVGVTTNPDTGVYCTAYKQSSTGNFAIVIINVLGGIGKKTLTIKGVTAPTIAQWVTSATQNLAMQNSIVGTDSGFTVSIDYKSVTTLVGTAGVPTRVCKPIITAPHYYLINPIEATISSETQGAEIYYTIDGSTPTSASLHYTAPFIISNPTVVKAISVKAGLESSEVVTTDFYAMRTAVSPSNPVNGLHYARYGYGMLYLLDFAKLTAPLSLGIQSDVTVEPWSGKDMYAVEFSGYLDVPTDGYYSFFMLSDDGSKLWIDSMLVVDNDGFHNKKEMNGEIALQAGKHRFLIDYFDRAGSDTLVLSWQGPGINRQQIPTAQYFTDSVVTRVVPDSRHLKNLPGMVWVGNKGLMINGLQDGPYSVILSRLNGQILFDENVNEPFHLISKKVFCQGGMYVVRLQNKKTHKSIFYKLVM